MNGTSRSSTGLRAGAPAEPVARLGGRTANTGTESGAGGPAKSWVVFCSRQFLVNGASGNAAYLMSIARYLKTAGYRVGFLSVSPDGFGVRPFARLGRDVELFDDYRINGWRRLGSWAVRIDSAGPWLIAAVKLVLRAAMPGLGGMLPTRMNAALNEFLRRRWDMSPTSREELAFAQRHLSRLDPQAVYVNYFYLADIASLPAATRARTYIITHSVFFDRCELYRKLNVRPEHPMISRRREIAALEKSERVIAIQESDAQILRRYLPAEKVVVAPMACPVRQGDLQRAAGRCLFVGASSQHNVLGLGWFLDRVWPAILRSEPRAQLHVCGDICRDFRRAFPRVVFRGRVADLAEEYGRAMVAVIPLIVGSGLKVKLVEAICHGRAAVTTSIGAQGLEPILAGIAAVTDEPERFASEVVDLLRNQDRLCKAEARALDVARRNFSAEVCYGGLLPAHG